MRKFLSLFLVIALAGCGDSITGVGAQIDGTYDLYSIDGERLPYYLGYDSDLDADVDIVNSVLTVRSNGTFEEDSDFNLYVTGRTTPSRLEERYVGRVSGSRSNLEFHYTETNERYDAEYTGEAIIMYTPDGMELVYVQR